MKTISAEEIHKAIRSLAASIAAKHANTPQIVLAGIANGGIACQELLFAELKELTNNSLGKGIIDISFHRDDIGRNPITKEVQATQLFHNPEDAVIILIDDVIFSGRTIRAAIDEIHTIGRPQKIELAVLVDRGNRKLPIAPDYIGLTIETTPEQKVDVSLDPDSPDNNTIAIG